MRPVYDFSYAAPDIVLTHHGKGPAMLDRSAHMLRDGDALHFLADALDGFFVADTVPNYPPRIYGLPPAESPILPTDALLLLATRPPMDDDKEVEKRFIERSETKLESLIFAGLGRFVDFCSRKEIRLVKEVGSRSRTPSPCLYYHFSPYGVGYIDRRGPSEEEASAVDENIALGFLVYLPSLSQNAAGPALLACFGMSGVITLAWSLHLRAASERGDSALSLPYIVEKNSPRLIVAEFDFIAPMLLPPKLSGLINGAASPRIVVDVEL